MSFIFDKDIDWLFFFCKNCWEIRKFTFSEPIQFNKKVVQTGVCVKCKSEQTITAQECRDYYRELNENNE